MNASTLRGIGIGLFVLALILGFVAYERYQANANSVTAMKQFMGGFPTEMMGVKEITPGVPTATRYALFFAVLSVAGGVGCLVMARRTPPATASQPPPADV